MDTCHGVPNHGNFLPKGFDVEICYTEMMLPPGTKSLVISYPEYQISGGTKSP